MEYSPAAFFYRARAYTLVEPGIVVSLAGQATPLILGRRPAVLRGIRLAHTSCMCRFAE